MILNEILEKRTKGEYHFKENVLHSEECGDYSEYDEICPYCKYGQIDYGDFKKIESHFKSLFGANSKKWEDECAKWCENNKICDCFASYNDD